MAVQGPDPEGKYINQAIWNDANYDLSPSVSNLRIGGLRRRTSSACCLNIFLLFALLLALAVILYFTIAPLLIPEKMITRITVPSFCGKMRGIQKEGVVEFLGIPYALPPVGDRRFRYPVELTSEKLCTEAWGASNSDADQVHETTEYKTSCMQLTPITDEIVGSEDCLYLNVFVPPSETKALTTELKPVIVIINGLFFMYGGSSGLVVTAGQQPHPTTVKSVDAIHVTFNYRIGPLGFFVHPLTKEANLGLYDQIAVLRWVRNNIGSFGGDPSRVTLFGYGSGATSVLALSHSQLAQNLFDGIWMSAPALGIPSTSVAEAINTSLYLFNCDPSGVKSQEQCFSQYSSAESIVRLWNWKLVEPWLRDHMFSLPTILNENARKMGEQNMLERILIDDGNLIEADRWLKPSYSIPVVIGQSAHETSLYVDPTTVPFWDENFYRQYLLRKLNKEGSPISKNLIEHHIASASYLDQGCLNTSRVDEFDVEAHMTALITDARFTCPLVKVAKELVDRGDLVYQYYLKNSHRRFDPYSLTSFVSLAFHGWDGMLYLRGYLTHPDYMEPTALNEKNDIDELEKASNLLNQAVHSFVSTGKIEHWFPVGPGVDYTNLIDEEIECKKQNYLKARCKLWEQLTEGKTLRLAWQA